MIQHRVLIGGTNVTKWVTKIETNVEVDGDGPANCTVTLANPRSKFTSTFLPQVDYVYVTLINNGTPYDVFTGSVTDCKADPKNGEITINAECDLGHLLDCIPQNIDFTGKGEITAKQQLTYMMKLHDPPIAINIDSDLEDKHVPTTTFDPASTFDAVIYHYAELLGAVVFTDDAGIVQLKDLNHISDAMDLSKVTERSDIAVSLMGYCNKVVCTGYAVLDPDTAYNTASNNRYVGTYVDQPGVDKYGLIEAPMFYKYNITSNAEAQKAAEDRGAQYKIQENSLTEITVQGKVPMLQCLISWRQFAEPRDPPGHTWYGTVCGRKIQYSSEGIVCILSVHPLPDQASAKAAMDAIVTQATPTINPDPGNSVQNADGSYNSEKYPYRSPGQVYADFVNAVDEASTQIPQDLVSWVQQEYAAAKSWLNTPIITI